MTLPVARSFTSRIRGISEVHARGTKRPRPDRWAECLRADLTAPEQTEPTVALHFDVQHVVAAAASTDRSRTWALMQAAQP